MHRPRPVTAALLLAALTLFPGSAPADGAPPDPHRVSAPTAPTFVLQEGKLEVQVLLDAESVGADAAALSLLTAHPGAAAPDHTHEGAELIYVLEGRATMTLDGQVLSLVAGDAVHIPAGAHHTFAVPEDAPTLKIVQVYVPGGPEQRFKKGQRVEPGGAP